MAIRSGRMRNIISIQQPPATANPFTTTNDWTYLYKDIRAKKILLKATEENKNSGQFARNTYQFSIRFQKNITTACRVLENGVIFDIVGIENVNERNHELRLDCAQISRLSTTGL